MNIADAQKALEQATSVQGQRKDLSLIDASDINKMEDSALIDTLIEAVVTYSFADKAGRIKEAKSTKKLVALVREEVLVRMEGNEMIVPVTGSGRTNPRMIAGTQMMQGSHNMSSMSVMSSPYNLPKTTTKWEIETDGPAGSSGGAGSSTFSVGGGAGNGYNAMPFKNTMSEAAQQSVPEPENTEFVLPIQCPHCKNELDLSMMFALLPPKTPQSNPQ